MNKMLAFLFILLTSTICYAKDVPLLKNIEGFEYIVTKPNYTIKFMWPDSEEHEILLRAAVAEWNHAAKNEEFITFTDGDANINVIVLNYTEGDTVGLALPFGPNQCTILIKTDHSLNPLLYLHELGHCLGFAHTNDKREIMYPVLQKDNYTIGKSTSKTLRKLIKNI